MIKKALWIVMTLSWLLFTGCSDKLPELTAGGNNNITDETAISGDAVSIDESAYGSGSGKNSSADGFQSVYFGFGEYSVSSAMSSALAKNVSVASSVSKKIKIEGNCDEFGTDEYNYALGLKRAKAIKDSLTAQGVSSSKIVIVSFGESNPVCSSPTDACYGKNRRVDLRLIK